METISILIELKEAVARIETRLTVIETEIISVKENKKTRINYVWSATIGIMFTVLAKALKLL